MTIIGFWNVDSLHGRARADRDVARVAAALATERGLDLLFLIECDLPGKPLAGSFPSEPEYFLVPSSERFKVIARFNPRLMARLSSPVPSDRYDIWHLQLPLQETMLLAVVHGLDKRNNSTAKQELFLGQVATAIAHFEKQLGIDRSVVVGDLNANPFESPVASMLGMNAVLSRAIASGEARRMQDRQTDFFYNPMWNLLGDEPRDAPPATYYYRGSDPHELYWHMLDQVLLRPSLLDRFDATTLEIVTEVQGEPLVGRGGLPNRSRFSDHLPVVFEIDLSIGSRR